MYLFFQKSNKQKNNYFLLAWHLKGQGRKLQDPDPLVRGMDPRIRIRRKMRWIRNTVWQIMRVLVYLSNCDDHAEELLRSVEQSPVLRRVSNLWKGKLF